jgi:glutaredoxin
MRKVVILVISLILIFSTNNVFGETWNIVSEWIWESIYIYYYWEWCSHCAKVEEYMEWVDAFNKVNITKKEIYSDDANRTEYLAAWERLWISEADLWIPFLIINNWVKETSLIWDEKIINHFKSFLWEAQESSKKTVILVILWILAVFVPVILIKLSNKN